MNSLAIPNIDSSKFASLWLLLAYESLTLTHQYWWMIFYTRYLDVHAKNFLQHHCPLLSTKKLSLRIIMWTGSSRWKMNYFHRQSVKLAQKPHFVRHVPLRSWAGIWPSQRVPSRRRSQLRNKIIRTRREPRVWKRAKNSRALIDYQVAYWWRY